MLSRCFATLRRQRSIRRSVLTSTMQTLVVSLVLSRLNCGNARLVGLPIYLKRRLKSVLNSSARLIYDLRRSDHITDALASLHRLRVPGRIKYKTVLLTFHPSRHGIVWSTSKIGFFRRVEKPLQFRLLWKLIQLEYINRESTLMNQSSINVDLSTCIQRLFSIWETTSKCTLVFNVPSSTENRRWSVKLVATLTCHLAVNVFSATEKLHWS